MTNVLFVYGTLKTGECRHGVLTRMVDELLEVKHATIKGKLYDLGPYPAVVEGDETVYGEVVVLPDRLMAEAIPVLDQIEGFYGGGSPHNLYNRVVTKAEVDGEQIDAVTYLFSKPSTLETYADHVPEGVWHSTERLANRH